MQAEAVVVECHLYLSWAWKPVAVYISFSPYRYTFLATSSAFVCWIYGMHISQTDTLLFFTRMHFFDFSPVLCFSSQAGANKIASLSIDAPVHCRLLHVKETAQTWISNTNILKVFLLRGYQTNKCFKQLTRRPSKEKSHKVMNSTYENPRIWES